MSSLFFLWGFVKCLVEAAALSADLKGKDSTFRNNREVYISFSVNFIPHTAKKQSGVKDMIFLLDELRILRMSNVDLF